MKKVLFRVSLVAGLVVLWVVGNLGMDWGQSQTSRTTFEFHLPLPQRVADFIGFEIQASDVERVYVTGFFTYWNSAPADYQLAPVGPGRWAKTVVLEPGANEYRFVFYLKNDDTAYWTYMENGDPLNDDQLRQFNNIHTTPDWSSLRQAFQNLMTAAAFSLGLFLIFDSFIRRLLKFRLAFRWKIIWVLMPILLLSGGFLVVLQVPRLQLLTKQSFFQEANWFYSILLRNQIDFKNLHNPRTLEALKVAMASYFEPLKTREEPNKPLDSTVGLSRVTLYDLQGQQLATYLRKNSRPWETFAAHQLGYANPETYSREFLGAVIRPWLQAEKVPRQAIMLASGFPFFSWDEQLRIWLQGGDCLLVPVPVDGQVQGYFLFNVLDQIFGAAIFDTIVLNVLLLIPLFFVIGLLLYRTGRSITRHLEILTSWTQQLVGGDFTVTERLITGDEIGTLATNFEQMRLSLDQHRNHLNQLVSERTAELQVERQRSERLLLNILPVSIADRLKASPDLIADDHESVSVLFADIVAFSHLASRTGAHALVQFLNQVFSRFDELIEEFRLEKIKTIGDAYMVAGGLEPGDVDHCFRMVRVAQEMLASTPALLTPAGEPIQLRIGLHLGPVVAGVIGTRKFIYDLWGETVNLASRMESHGLPGRIQLSNRFYQTLDGAIEAEPRTEVEIKGHGLMKTWLVL